MELCELTSLAHDLPNQSLFILCSIFGQRGDEALLIKALARIYYIAEVISASVPTNVQCSKTFYQKSMHKYLNFHVFQHECSHSRLSKCFTGDRQASKTV